MKCDPKFVSEFATELHSILEKTKSCFLSGTFVIGDNNEHDFLKQIGQVQNFNYERKTVKVKGLKLKIPVVNVPNLIGECRRRHGDMSHTLFLNDEDFQKTKNNTTESKIVYASGQHEVTTDVPIIEYGCDIDCRNNPSTECKNKQVPKKSLLWSIFKVEQQTELKNYVFFKLEGNPALDIEHILAAAKHYFTKDGAKRDNGYDIRREDMTFVDGESKYSLHCEPVIEDGKRMFKYKNDDRPHPGYTFQDKDDNDLVTICTFLQVDYDIARQEKEWYDSYVRTRDEMFIPFVVAQKITANMKLTGGGGGSRNSVIALTALAVLFGTQIIALCK